MIPQEAKFNFQEIINHEMFEMDRSLAAVMAATQAGMAARGLSQSGPAMQALKDDVTNSHKAKGQFILGQLLRCLAAHRVALDSDVVNEATALLRDTIQAQAHLMQSRLFQFGVFNTAGLGQAKQQLQAQFAQEGPRLTTRLTTELRLAAAASTAQAVPAQGSTTLNFNAPVGLVQTGNGNQATVNQHIDAGLKNEIVAVLQQFLDQLDRPENNSLGSRAQLRELVVDAKAEAEKPNTNTLKLGSSLRTIAETTKFVGSLGPAYQVLKPLLSFFGIHLP